MSITLEQLEDRARSIAGEHRRAIEGSEATAKALANRDSEYHRALAVEVAIARQEFKAASVAETMAKGTDRVNEAREARDVAAAYDRAAMERIRLARDDRAALLAIAGWSRAAEAME